MDQQNLVGIEQVVGDDQTAQRILRDHTAGIADDVGITGLETEKIFL